MDCQQNSVTKVALPGSVERSSKGIDINDIKWGSKRVLINKINLKSIFYQFFVFYRNMLTKTVVAVGK